MQMSRLTGRSQLVVALLTLLWTLLGLGSPARAQPSIPDLFISEYVEGSSNNKAIEIFNGAGTTIDLAAGQYKLRYYFNGSASPGLTINLTGAVAAGDVYLVVHSSASPDLLSLADQTNGAGWYNGDDAVVLVKGETIIDAIGQIGFDPGSEWGSGLTSTADNTLRRKAGVCAGDANASDPFDPSIEWDGFAGDTFDGLGAHSGCGAEPPAVVSISPANGAVNVPTDTTLSLTFSEPVNVSGNWYSIICSESGDITSRLAVNSADQTTFTFALVAGNTLPAGEQCTVNLTGSLILAVDDGLPAATGPWRFLTGALATCPADGDTPIHSVQGDGLTSPLAGQVVEVEGVVVGDYQDSFGGFFVQEEDTETDGLETTSEGIFIFDGSLDIPVAQGDLVRVKGMVEEFRGLTELSAVTRLLICGVGAGVTPTPVPLPVPDPAHWEAFEGMLVTIPQELTVSETFNLGRFGELLLSQGGRLFQPTQLAEPGAAAHALQLQNDLRAILLDDALNVQNPDPVRYLPPNGTLRVGDTLPNLTGVIDFRFDVYRIQPVAGAEPVFIESNPRPAEPPAVGGSLTVAAANLLNYFTTLDADPNNDQSGDCGPIGGQDCRGADVYPDRAPPNDEFTRQHAKTIAALAALDADIVGLIELENHPQDAALLDLVNGLNGALGAGTYAPVLTGPIGGDAIRVGLIYKPAVVTPLGNFAILDSSVDPRFLDDFNRPVLAQSFQENSTGEVLTVAVTHLKSKGSDCNDIGDPDTGDGQGNCNLTRTRAAEALADWLAGDPTGSGDPDVLIVGDLNAYAQEDPVQALTGRGYTDLIQAEIGATAYSFVFDGQSGYLDHALGSPNLTPQVSGVAEWHINADEPRIFDYNVEFKSPGQITDWYSPDPYRSADHDPLLVGLCLGELPALTATPAALWPPNHTLVEVKVSFNAAVVSATRVSVTSSEPDDGLGDGDTAGDIELVDNTTLRLRAERAGGGPGRIYTLTYDVVNRCGDVHRITGTVTVPAHRGQISAIPAEGLVQAGGEIEGMDAGSEPAQSGTRRIYLPGIQR